jgi:uncharacterized protein DUF4012
VDLVARVVVAAVAFAVTGGLASRWPRLLLARTAAPVVIVSLVAGVGGALAPGEPTALAGVDGLLRVGMAVAVTAASARARRQVWLLASTATVVAGTGAALDWLAFVATGVTLAMLVLGRRSWVVGAFIGACLVQVLLRLEIGGPTGTSAAVAAAVAGVLVASGLGGARRTTRRWACLTAGVLAGVAVLFTGAAALAGTRAAGHVRAGIDAGEEGLRTARQAQVPEAAGRFRHAAGRFEQAAAQLDRWWARPGLAVPIVGQHLRAVRIMSRAGEELARAASTTSAELDLQGLRLDRGAVDLAAVDRAADALGATRRALERAAASVDSARSPWLAQPLVEAIGDLDARMAEARRDVGTAADVLELAGPMLGRDGRRRYFLAVVTPAENRGSGGLVGNVGEITAEGGRLGLAGVQRIARLNEAVDDEAAARVLPPVYGAAYGAWNVPANLQNATVAADFPTTAGALEAVVPLTGQGEVDGAVSVDPLAVAAFLEIVGPVTVPSWPVPISAANAAAVLLHEQYVALAGDARENFLGEVIFAVWDRLTTGTLPSPASLARALGPAVQGRHIQLHSRRAEEQAPLGRLGADGALRRTGGHHLALVTNNASESKADWFLRRAVDYQLRYDPGTGSAEGTVRITLTNDAPPAGLPAYVLGGRVAPPGHNRQIVQVYTPFDLVTATVDGRLPPAALRSLGQAGNWAHELDVVVPSRASTVIELRLAGRLAPNRAGWTLEVARQPAVHPDDVAVTLAAADRWRIVRPRGGLSAADATATAHVRLDRNVQLGAEFERN